MVAKYKWGKAEEIYDMVPRELVELTQLVQSAEFIEELKLEIRLWQLHLVMFMSREEGIQTIAANPALSADLLISNNCTGGSLNMLMLLQKHGYGDFVITSSSDHTWLQNDKGIIIDAAIGQYTKKEQMFVGTVKDLPQNLQSHYVDSKPDEILQHIYKTTYKAWTDANVSAVKATRTTPGVLPSYSYFAHGTGTTITQPIASKQDNDLQEFAKNIAEWQATCIKEKNSNVPLRSVDEWKGIISGDFESLEQRGCETRLKLDYSNAGNYMMAMRDHVFDEASKGMLYDKESRLSAHISRIEEMQKSPGYSQ